MLVALGVALALWLSRRATPASMVVIVVLAVGGFTLGAVSTEPCQVESAYYCMRVEHDPFRASGRILWLDDLRHSYVDLADPTVLEFDYASSFADAVAAAFPDGQALDALHVGGGGFTLPRYLAGDPARHRRASCSRSIPRCSTSAATSSGCARRPRCGCGSATPGSASATRPTTRVTSSSGDAFGSLSVPWHLTTREFLREVDRVLRPGGVYVQNVIDYPTFRFARAELATLREQFEYVAAIAPQSSFDEPVRREHGAGRRPTARSIATRPRATSRPRTATWCATAPRSIASSARPR